MYDILMKTQYYNASCRLLKKTKRAEALILIPQLFICRSMNRTRAEGSVRRNHLII